MNISINDKVLEKYNLSLQDFLVLYLCYEEVNIEDTINSLIDRGIADRDLNSNVTAVISNNTKDLITAIIIDSDKAVISKDEEFNALAEKLRELYPEGKKPGTTYYWRDSVPMIARKLKTLVAKFGAKFTEEEAINATKKYVDSFNGDYRYMHLLKYFLLKLDKESGDMKSEFLSILQNKDTEHLGENWLVELK